MEKTPIGVLKGQRKVFQIQTTRHDEYRSDRSISGTTAVSARRNRRRRHRVISAPTIKRFEMKLRRRATPTRRRPERKNFFRRSRFYLRRSNLKLKSSQAKPLSFFCVSIKAFLEDQSWNVRTVRRNSIARCLSRIQPLPM